MTTPESAFLHQVRHNPVYGDFVRALGPADGEFPLLPVEAFRTGRVYAADTPPELVFRSSGTTGMRRSEHAVAKADRYRQAVFAGLDHFYPDWRRFVVAGYTPGYDRNPHSSLIHMIRMLIGEDASGLSRFLEPGQPVPSDWAAAVHASGRPVLLFGAAFGLMDLAEAHPFALPAGSIIMETGGMKTHRREMDRLDMHTRLAQAFAVPAADVHSEYGMTELLSQAYAGGDGRFRTPPWMAVSIRDPKNPILCLPDGAEGLIGIFDGANIDSCCFLLTGDRGRRHPDGSFEVLGRWKSDNLRGCNFLVDE